MLIAVLSFSLSAYAAEARIVSVKCEYNPYNDTYSEIVTVELSQEAIRVLNNSENNKYIVRVKPKSSVFSFFIDLRDAKTIVLTKDRPFGEVYFKSYRQCGQSDFIVETPWGPSR